MQEDDQQEDDQPMFFGADGRTMTAAEVRAEHDRIHATTEAFWADFKRMLFDELAEDQLVTLKVAFKQVADTVPDNAVRLGNYFEGLTTGALEAKLRSQPFLGFGDDEPAPDEGTLWSHQFLLRTDGTGQCVTCGTPYDTRPHQRWERGLRGDGSDGVDV